MINLKELSRLAGMDISTISRALNDSPRVKAKTKEYIKKLAAEHQYIPDDIARGLVGKRTYMIGIIIPEFSNTFYAEIIEGIDNLISNSGYLTIFGKTSFNKENEVKYVDLFLRKRVDGIIACSITQETLNYLNKYKKITPIILVDNYAPTSNFDSITVDNAYGVQSVMEYLINLGHKQIGFIGHTTATTERLDSYKKTLVDHGIPIDDNHISIGSERNELGGKLRMNNLLRSDRVPSAVFAVSDNMAIGAIYAIKESGLRVPEDISVIGFDDITVSSYLEMPLSTVLQPKFEMGRLAAELLMNRIEEKTAKFRQHVLLKPELLIRNTSKSIL